MMTTEGMEEIAKLAQAIKDGEVSWRTECGGTSPELEDPAFKAFLEDYLSSPEGKAELEEIAAEISKPLTWGESVWEDSEWL